MTTYHNKQDEKGRESGSHYLRSMYMHPCLFEKIQKIGVRPGDAVVLLVDDKPRVGHVLFQDENAPGLETALQHG
jgi:hypothetical protein